MTTDAAATVRATSRAIDWPPIAGAGVVLLALAAARKPWTGAAPDLMFLRGAALIGALALAFTFDDAAAVTLAPSPTSLFRRRLARIAVVVPAALSTIGILIAGSALLAAPVGVSLDVAPLLVEAGGVMMMALALAAVLPGAQAAGVLFTGIFGNALLQVRWPRWGLFPTGDMAVFDRTHVAWMALTAAAAVLLLFASRDPASR